LAKVLTFTMVNQTAQPSRRAAKKPRRGPPTAGAGNDTTHADALGGHAGASDDWQTCDDAWAAIAPLLRKRFAHKKLWMPFYYDGACRDHLNNLGFRHVVHEPGVDFFERARRTSFTATVDLVLDNPPYTSPETKESVLRALAATGLPFVMLLPISVLHVGYVREVLASEHIQVIVPRRVHVRKTNGERVAFKYLCWLCYRVGLERDLIFVE
jgi:hypothetical protein